MVKATQYPHPSIGEQTYKGYKWTLFHTITCHRRWPWTYIIVQAPLAVAVDVLRNGFGIDPYEVTCQEHESSIGIHEDADWPEWVFRQRGAVNIVTYDAVGYYANGIWEEPRWTE